MKRATLAIGALVLAVACSNSAVRSFSSIEQFRDAAVAAGLPCPSWKQTDAVRGALASGNCTQSDVLSLYATEADKEHALASMLELFRSKKVPVHLLAGPNWILNAKQVGDLKSLGGKLYDA